MNNKDLLVSVIMPAYNAEKFIGESIESILNQTFKDFEFIILDDCSADKTWEIIQEYAKKDERIVAVKNEKNLNIALNRNKGVEMSKGEYVVWQDADDISKPERIEKLVNYMESHPEVGICGSNFEGFYGDVTLGVREFISEDDVLRSNIFKFSPVSQGTAIIRKECFNTVGVYNPDYPVAEDLEFSFRVGEKYKFSNIPEVLLMYREHPNSTTHKKIKKLVQASFNVRVRYLNNSSYQARPIDYLALGLTWLFQFFPAKIVISIFKTMRKFILTLIKFRIKFFQSRSTEGSDKEI